MEIATCLEPVGVQLEGGNSSSPTLSRPQLALSELGLLERRTPSKRGGCIAAERVCQSADSFLLNGCVFCGNDKHSHPNYKTKKNLLNNCYGVWLELMAFVFFNVPQLGSVNVSRNRLFDGQKINNAACRHGTSYCDRVLPTNTATMIPNLLTVITYECLHACFVPVRTRHRSAPRGEAS